MREGDKYPHSRTENVTRQPLKRSRIIDQTLMELCLLTAKLSVGAVTL